MDKTRYLQHQKSGKGDSVNELKDLFATWNDYLNQFPTILTAILVFLIGWLAAALISRGIRGILARTKWDDRLFEMIKIDPKYKAHIVFGKIVFYVLMIFVVIMCFNILGLQFVAEPIVDMMSIITQSIPNILKAALILLFGWILATVLQFLIHKGGNKVGAPALLAKWKIIDNPEDADKALRSVGRVVFYLVLLIFLPGVLGALHIGAVSDPMSGMLAQFLAFLPKLFGASLTLLIGWIIAKIVREILTKFLQSAGLEKLGARAGLDKIFSKTSLSAVIGTIAYVFILIPTVISALETLDLKGISEPAIAMLTRVLSMIPNVLIGIVLVLVGVWLGRIVGKIVADLLERLGLNGVVKHLGIGSWDPSKSQTTLSQLIGRIVQIVILLLFVVEALQIVKLQVLVVLATALIAYLPDLFVALVVIGLGLFLGNFVHRIVASVARRNGNVLGAIAKYTILALSLFMALDQLGVASSIVNAAFILILGGFALAFGLAFGLGGREFAANSLQQWQQRLQAGESAGENQGSENEKE